MNRFVQMAVVTAAALLLQASAVAGDSLPTGVRRIVFGQAVFAKDSSHGQKCSIPHPLRSPVEFEAGVVEIAYFIEIDPHMVKRVKTSVIGDAGSPETKWAACSDFSICRSSLCQTQFGGTLARADGQPLKAGAYIVSLEIDGNSAKVPFTIK